MHQYNMDEVMKIILPLIVILILASCSNKGIYEGIQTSKRNECSKVPPSQYDECMEKANKSYDEYEREREKDLGQ